MPTPSSTKPEETFAAFHTEEPFKAVARRLGLSPNTLRKWWLSEFGRDAFDARGNATVANGKTKAGLAQRAVVVDGKKRCTKCGAKKWLRLFNVRSSSFS
jgi:transposase-like protein